MKKGILLVLLPCLLFSGCVSKSDYEAAVSAKDHLWASVQEESNRYGLLMSAFKADMCGGLNADHSSYQVVINRTVENYSEDLGACAALFESLEKNEDVAAPENEILCIYVKYVDSEGRSLVDVLLRRNTPNDSFELKLVE